MNQLTAPILLLGGTADQADVRYVTGFTAPDPFLYLDAGSERILLVSQLEYGRTVKTNGRIRSLMPRDLPIALAERRRLSGCAYGLLKLLNHHVVVVTGNFPIAIARRLERKGIRVRVMEAAAYPRRALKSANEIAQIARVQLAAAASIKAAVRHLHACTVDRAGFIRDHGKKLTSEKLRQIIGIELLQRNCNPGEPIVSSGPASANGHERGSGPIRAGTPIIMDVFPSCQASGYFGDITRTVCKGRAPEELRRMKAAVQQAQRRALQTIRAGVALTTPYNVVVDFFKRCGFETKKGKGTPQGFIHGLGHGVGLEIHEAPSLSLNAAGRLRAGHVVTVEPGLYYPHIGGVRFEDTVVVTATGWRLLAPCPVPWEV